MTRKLRRTVLRFSSCLDDVSTLQRRVLLLRAGLGAGPARSRRAVARRLDLRPRRVMRLERKGLRKMRALVRRGSCDAGDGGAGVPSGGAVTGAGGADGGGSPLLASADGASGSAGTENASLGSGSTSGSAPNGGESGGVRGESDSRSPELFSSGGDGSASSAVPGGTPIAIAVALILLAALAGFAAPQVGRRVRSG